MEPQTDKQLIKSLRIVHFALMFGVLSFLIMGSVLIQLQGAFAGDDPEFANLLLAVSSILAIIAIPVGITIFNKRIQKASSKSFSEKLVIYRDAMIIRTATIEGPAFFFLVAYVLTGSPISLAEAVICLGLLFLFFPNNTRLSKELNTDYREIENALK